VGLGAVGVGEGNRAGLGLVGREGQVAEASRPRPFFGLVQAELPDRGPLTVLASVVAAVEELVEVGLGIADVLHVPGEQAAAGGRVGVAILGLEGAFDD